MIRVRRLAERCFGNDLSSSMYGIDEKPIQRFFVNAGIYVLEPEILSVIPQNSFYDMPSLFDELILKHEEISAFPIREYWKDIGHMGDYKQANGDFDKVFSGAESK